MRVSSDNRINTWVKVFIRLGWAVVRGGRHARLISPDGKIKLTVPGTPSDSHAVQNWRSQVRRISGIDPAMA